MVRMFTGKGGLAFGAVTRDVLKEAIENIHHHFCYVGFQHRTSEAVASLASYLKLQPNPLREENLGSYKGHTGVSSFAIQRLRELNEFDREIFEYVEKKFWSNGGQGWISKQA
jgi:hypothetical protein